MIERLKICFIGFAVFWILLLPFDYSFFDWLFTTFQFPFFTGLRAVDSSLVFESDTYGTYLLLVLSVSLGAIFSFATVWVCKKLNATPTHVLKTVLAAILFFFLFKYGWDKVVKLQFYLPEPNTVYTPFGKLSKDIAYWSIVGSSYSYSVTLGIIEMMTALLLLFKRTQFLASLLSIAVFGQIFLINCSFDISVKLLSGTLLCFSLIYSACFKQQWVAIFGYPNRVHVSTPTRSHQLIKMAFAGLVVLECAIPSFINGNLNDDNFPRLKHHGAYEVIGSSKIKRVYIHRNHYLILEHWNGKLADFRIATVDQNKYEALEVSISCLWNEKSNKLLVNQDTFIMKSIPYRELPLLKEDFHLFSDQFH